jgi:predicted enzyme related to lactoylglutathione lyase
LSCSPPPEHFLKTIAIQIVWLDLTVRDLDRAIQFYSM